MTMSNQERLHDIKKERYPRTMKKMLATLLALMLLAMPFAGLAEETAPAQTLDLSAMFANVEEEPDHYTQALEAGRRLSFSVDISDVAEDFTGEPAVDQVIADMLNALDITGYVQGEEVCFAISMEQANGTLSELLSMGVAVSGDDAYMMSNLIGGTIVVGKDEAVPVLQRLMDMLAMLGFITEDDAAAAKEQLPEMWAELTAEFEAAMAAAPAEIDPATLDYSAIVNTATMFMGKMVPGTPDVLPRNCDPAVAMVTMTLTPDEMKDMMVSFVQFIKDNPALSAMIASEIEYETTIAPEFGGVAGEAPTFDAFLDKAIEELRNADLYAGDVVMRAWLGADGGIVAMDIVAPVQNGEEIANITLTHSRLTMNDSVANSVVMAMPGGADMTLNVVEAGNVTTANFAMAENGETRLEIAVNYTDRSATNWDAFDLVVDMTMNDATVTADAYYYVGDDYNSVESSEVVDTINIKMEMSSDTIFNGIDFGERNAITVSVDGKEYLTINLQCSSSEPVESIMTGNVVRPAELSDADFANWFANVYTTLFSWPQRMIFALPASFINLMNTGY